jgi:hypothetical protein
MELTQAAIVTLGALAGGFVSGLAGFGTGITAMGFWLHAVSPPTATSLSILCSITSQAQTFPAIRHAIKPRQVLPFIIPGLVGIPIGGALLTHIDPGTFRIAVGILLIVFAAFGLSVGTGLNIAWGGRLADGAVGLAGGIMGGLAGLPGPLTTIWATVRGLTKDQRRALFQAYNMSMSLAALLLHTVSGHINGQVLLALAAALPGTFTGAWLGARTYRRMNDRHFNTVILVLLAISGATLVFAGL